MHNIHIIIWNINTNFLIANATNKSDTPETNYSTETLKNNNNSNSDADLITILDPKILKTRFVIN